MFLIHITEKALEEICLGKYPNWLAVAKKQTKIVIAVNNSDIFMENENPINIFIKSYGVFVEPNNDYINKIPQDPKSVLNNPCGAFILDIDKKTAKQIELDFGVICQSADNINDNSLQYSKEISSEEHEEIHNWNNFLQFIKSTPSNTLMVNDRYIFANDDSLNKNGIHNATKIIDAILPVSYKCDYHVLIIFDSSQLKPGITFSNIANWLNRGIRGIRPYSIKLELISVKKNCYLYENTHNRRIISNYSIIRTEHKFKAFYETRSLCSQTLNCDMLYSKGIIDESDCPAKSHSKTICDLKSVASYGKTHATAGYEYACNGNTNLPLSNLQNRLL
jgi:hypothetical protein